MKLEVYGKPMGESLHQACTNACTDSTHTQMEKWMDRHVGNIMQLPPIWA